MRQVPGLYVHIPFCSAICPYCDFAVTTGGAAKRTAFAEALEAEIDLVTEDWEPVETIYLGGGTPSALGLGDLGRLLTRLRGRFDPDGTARLFLEANPEDVTVETASGWRDLGVATLCLGVQSFDDETLQILGRRHGPDEARAAVATALGAGFESVSVDLIYGVPGRTLADWKVDLEKAIELAPDHLSCYQLTFHRQTPFGRWKASGRLVEPSQDEHAALFLHTHERLAAAGYDGYEVSNFARSPEHFSRHNRKYWTHDPYLGLGPSAHSFDGERRRWWNERDLAAWSARIGSGARPLAGEEVLDAADKALERVMLGLRTRDGVDLAALEGELGLPLVAPNRELLTSWQRQGLAEVAAGRVLPTLRGLAVADRLTAELAI